MLKIVNKNFSYLWMAVWRCILLGVLTLLTMRAATI
jgi:hypothetical protein